MAVADRPSAREAKRLQTRERLMGATGLDNIAGTVDGGEISDSLDGLIDLVAELQTNLSTPSLILLSPTAWAEFRKLKVGGPAMNSSLIGAGTTDAAQLLLSLPVLVNVAVPPLTGYVIDKSAVVSAYGEVNVNTSDHQLFRSDSPLSAARGVLVIM
jgi:hypothetical protein